MTIVEHDATLAHAAAGGQRPFCHRPWTGFELFDHLGDVRPCCWGKVSCGNVNEQSATEIWNGDGFALYRERMLVGDLDAICNRQCPILNGEYREPILEAPDPRADGVIEPQSETMPPPRFLRVVPSIKCNLRCPMCYQLSDPPPQLPGDFATIFDHWLPHASELLVLGGEPFLSRDCLRWIEKASPSQYPDLRLAAITNGLAFGAAAIELVRTRRWSWILVSIDAATAPTYKKVRGGEFAMLGAGLDALAEARALSLESFELRFGFTIQNDNLDDAIPFLDLCAKYNARPQFTGVFGDWHDQRPRTWRQWRAHVACLEALDKELSRRGFPYTVILSALCRVLEQEPETGRHRPAPIPIVFETEDILVDVPETETLVVSTSSARQVVAVARRHQNGANPPDLEVISIISGNLLHCGEHHSDPNVDDPGRQGVLIQLDEGLRAAWPSIRAELATLPQQDYWLSLPFQVGGTPTSALSWRPFANDVINFCTARGWAFQGGLANVVELGLIPSEQKAEQAIILAPNLRQRPRASIITAAHNAHDTIPRFLNSLARQRGIASAETELILADDGSLDSTLAVALAASQELHEFIPTTLLKLERTHPYKPGTFSFRTGLARQLASNHAQGDVLIFLDPDQEVDVDCLASHLFLHDKGMDVVIGDRDYEVDVGSARHDHWERLRHAALNAEPAWWMSFFTGNASVTRAKFDAAGGFDPALQYWGLDDTDLGYRLAQQNPRIWHSTRARVTHAGSQADSQSGDKFLASQRLHMEVLYRKYFDHDILDHYKFCYFT